MLLLTHWLWDWLLVISCELLKELKENFQKSITALNTFKWITCVYEVGKRSWSVWWHCKALAHEASHLTVLVACTWIYAITNSWCSIPKCSSSSLSFLPFSWEAPERRKFYEYALKIVDVSSRFTVAEPLTSKNAAEVSRALQIIYECVPHR